jgi:hypothetical protein
MRRYIAMHVTYVFRVYPLYLLLGALLVRGDNIKLASNKKVV